LAVDSALGLGLEGLSREDSEFEATRQFVRFAAKTVKNAAGIAPPIVSLTHRAAAEAARIYAAGPMIGGARHGRRWAPRRPDPLLRA
jgi:hypothetical protein